MYVLGVLGFVRASILIYCDSHVCCYEGDDDDSYCNDGDDNN